MGSGTVEGTPQAVAAFLREHLVDQDKGQLGEYLGHHEDFAVSNFASLYFFAKKSPQIGTSWMWIYGLLRRQKAPVTSCSPVAIHVLMLWPCFFSCDAGMQLLSCTDFDFDFVCRGRSALSCTPTLTASSSKATVSTLHSGSSWATSGFQVCIPLTPTLPTNMT